MPLFEYVCLNKKCQHVFTELAKFEDVFKCPTCGKKSEKQIATTHHPVFVHRQGSFAQRRGKAKRKTRI
jgi:putative FmdB family regulatory protein